MSLDTIIKKFEPVAIEDRLQYQSVYVLIETYLANHEDVFMGGSYAVTMLLHKKMKLQDYSYVLYSAKALNHANTLSNLLSELNWTVMLKTIIPYKRFDIIIDQRTMIKFYTLDVENDVVEPIVLESYLAKQQVRVISPKAQLVDTYRTLYSPSSVDQWQDSLRDERRLFGWVKRQYESETPEITGAGEREKISTAIMKDFITNNRDVVLIGEHAIFVLAKTPIESSVVQIIMKKTPQKDLETILSKIITKTVGKKYPISFSSRDTNAIGDFRLRRVSVRVDIDGFKEIMYIYEAADYDIIPFNRLVSDKNVIQIGNPFVLIRFCLLELWILQQVLSAGTIEEKFAAVRNVSMIKKLIAMRSTISDDSGRILDRTVQPGNTQIFQYNQDLYYGNYENDADSVKRIKEKNKFGDYFPQEWKKTNGTYRTFN